MRKLVALSFVLLPFSANSIGFVGVAAKGGKMISPRTDNKVCVKAVDIEN